MATLRTAKINKIQDLIELSAVQADIFMVNFYKEINFTSYYAVPEIIKVARDISYDCKCAIFLCAKINIEDDNYYSTVVFHNGVILGISDSISEEKYVHGKQQKIFRIGDKKIGVCVGRDFLYSSVNNMYLLGADIILHQTHAVFDKQFYHAVKGRVAFNEGKFVSMYDDLTIVYDGDLYSGEEDKDISVDLTVDVLLHHKGFLKFSELE